MSWYKEYRNQWKEIIQTVAAEMHRTVQMVEKDTIQSMFLLHLSKCELPFVFKGGTSLSKGYGLIDRFSEDIDLSMNRKPTEAEKKKSKKIILGIAENLGFTLENPQDVQSKHSYNKLEVGLRGSIVFVRTPVLNIRTRTDRMGLSLLLKEKLLEVTLRMSLLMSLLLKN
ncbi:Nucleotidyl transferase AbiEii toxin, Type IV TA system [Lachnospiraceae bacterium XBB1006]|nr:Nucleotidyl transferase AbiEii toxin, Type IV TA system [Lachnospiraceae bacterium XBB1006]